MHAQHAEHVEHAVQSARRVHGLRKRAIAAVECIPQGKALDIGARTGSSSASERGAAASQACWRCRNGKSAARSRAARAAGSARAQGAGRVALTLAQAETGPISGKADRLRRLSTWRAQSCAARLRGAPATAHARALKTSDDGCGTHSIARSARFGSPKREQQATKCGTFRPEAIGNVTALFPQSFFGAPEKRDRHTSSSASSSVKTTPASRKRPCSMSARSRSWTGRCASDLAAPARSPTRGSRIEKRSIFDVERIPRVKALAIGAPT